MWTWKEIKKWQKSKTEGSFTIYTRDGATIQIGSKCKIAPSVKISDRCSIHHSVTIAKGTTIGKCTSVLSHASIAENVDIHSVCQIGMHSVIESGVTICRNTTLGTYANVGSGSIIDSYVSVGQSVHIRNNVWIGERSIIGDCVQIGSECSIEKKSILHPGTVLESSDWWMTIGPQGSRKEYLTVVASNSGVLRWYVGCQRGITTKKLKSLIKSTHRNGPEHYDDYMHVIKFVETHPRVMARRKTPRWWGKLFGDLFS